MSHGGPRAHPAEGSILRVRGGVCDTFRCSLVHDTSRVNPSLLLERHVPLRKPLTSAFDTATRVLLLSPEFGRGGQFRRREVGAKSFEWTRSAVVTDDAANV